MRTACNQQGWNVELLTLNGWRATGFGNPYDTTELAQAAMAGLMKAAPGRELRVYPNLKAKP